MNRDIGKIITDLLNNELIKDYFINDKNICSQDDEVRLGIFARMIGYCILFKESNDILKYMELDTYEKQVLFLKLKIADRLGIKYEEIDNRMDEVNSFIYDNFIRDGYLFHAGNSNTIINNLKNGLDYEDNLDERLELLYIDSIFKKYGVDSPFGWGIVDINNRKNGWFYDNFPRNMLYYGSSSPEWFSQFCGESGVYSCGFIKEEERHGYPNRDYEASYLAVIRLLEKYNMSDSDRHEIINFFNKCWDRYGEGEPYLLFIPATSLRCDIELEKMHFLHYFDGDELFDEVINCENGLFGFDKCSSKFIEPEDLSYVDLSPILPRYKISNYIKEKEYIKK